MRSARPPPPRRRPRWPPCACHHRPESHHNPPSHVRSPSSPQIQRRPQMSGRSAAESPPSARSACLGRPPGPSVVPVERGNIPYSAVNQPSPFAAQKPRHAPAFTLAVQITLVLPERDQHRALLRGTCSLAQNRLKRIAFRDVRARWAGPVAGCIVSLL